MAGFVAGTDVGVAVRDSNRLQQVGRAWRAAALASAVTMSATATAQVSPSQVVPRDFRPPPSIDPLESTAPSAAPVEAPADTASLTVRVGHVVVSGSIAGRADFDRASAAALDGRRIGIGELYRTAAVIEAGYATAGYPLVRVVVPPQRLVDDGPVRLQVVDGFIERIDVAAVPTAMRRAVAARLAPLVQRPGLRAGALERGVLLVGDLPGLRVRTTLKSGNAPGATVLVVEATQRPIELRLDIANMLSDTLGRVQIGTTLVANGVLGVGEQAYASFQGGADPYTSARIGEPLRVFGGGLVMPVGVDGWTINPEFSTAKTRPARQPGVLATDGRFTRATLRTSYPLVRRRDETLVVTATLDATHEANRASDFGIDLFRDGYRAMRLGFSWDSAARGIAGASARVLAGVTLVHGLGGRTAAKADPLVPLSRVDAGARFTSLAVGVRADQLLGAGVALTVQTRGQTSFGRPLLRAEQTFLDGADAISPAASGTFAVDQAVTVRGEVGRSFATGPGPTQLGPYLFAAAGAGRLERPTVVERQKQTATAWGVGVRGGGVGPISPIFALELGRRESNLPTVRDGWRTNVHATLRY